MCSIIGYYKLKTDAIVNKTFVKHGLELMRHRGPDAESVQYFNDKNVCLGSQRLAIVDVNTGANQPMLSSHGALVFNGEIYNYIELRQILKQNRVPFVTESDTEVLLKGLEKNGTKFLNSTNGMFAFAKYSTTDKSLLIARDRFGVKPVYYMVEADVLYFSSELRPLISIKKKIERNNKYYQSFFQDTATDYDEGTHIKGVFQVKPGHFLTVTNKRINQKKWYFGKDFHINNEIFQDSEKTLTFVEDLLVDALRIRIRADVPASISLSGGLDSSVLYVLAHERLKINLMAFSLFDKTPELSEKTKIKRLVKSYGEKVESFTYSDKNLVDDLKKCLVTTEFPIWDPSVVIYDQLYRKIRAAGFKMVIEGHGSDELLGGYSYMIEEAITDYLKEHKYFTGLRLLQDNLTMNVYAGKQSLLKKYFYLFLRSRNRKNNSTFEEIIEKSFTYKILPIVLRAFDRLSMFNSLESRAPFMDYRVVEVFKRLPKKYKVDTIGSKAILRQILKKYGKDYIYLDKRKIGFGIKTEELLNSSKEMKLFFEECISEFEIAELDALKQKARMIITQKKISASDVTLLWKVAAVAYMDKQLYKNYE